MSSKSMVQEELPPGFRFHPRDDELICDYLIKKLTRCKPTLLIEVDLNKCEPWDIPETACVGGKEWYFYSQRDRKYAIGLRTNRATSCGYWKATGKDRHILRKGTLVGMRKTLVFYQGRAPKGSKTDWVMHEFRLEGPFHPPKVSCLEEDWVLCRVLHKKKGESIQNKGISCYYYNNDMNMSSSSLPPLTDSYITFNPHNNTITNTNATTTTDDINNQQVPCLSIFSENQTNQNNNNPISFISSSSSSSIMEPRNYNLPNMPTFGGDILTYMNAPLACDKDVFFKSYFLDHLTKFEISTAKDSISLGETSSESYLYS